MPVPSEVHAVFESAFGRLLIQVAEEHKKQLTILQQELKELRQCDGVNSLSGQERLPLETESAKDFSLPTVAADKPAAISSTEVYKPPLPLKTNSDEHRKIQEWEPKETAQSKARSSSAESEMTQMHWELKGEGDEEADELALKITRSKIGRFFRLRTETVKNLILWWDQSHQPKNKNTYVYRLVESKEFMSLCLFVIFLNTLHIMWGTDEDIRSVISNPQSFQQKGAIDGRFWVDLCFCIFYSIELILKMYAYGLCFFAGEDCKWNLFDTGLVVFSVFDTIITAALADEAQGRPNLTFLRALRTLRMARVMRMVRAVKWIQELRLMLDCVLNSAFHLFWCIILIILVLIIFSLLLIQGATSHLSGFTKDPIQFEYERDLLTGKFDTVPNAMLSLFQATTGGDDWTQFYSVVQRSGAFYDFVFLFYIAFFAIVAWNIVMSTFVEKALKLATPDIDTMVMEQRRKELHYAKELTNILESCMDENGDHVISFSEFKTHMMDQKVRKFFRARDLDMKDAELFFRMLASVENVDGLHGHVDIKTFVLGCMRLRGVASNIDVQSLHYDMKNFFQIERAEIRKLCETVQQYFPTPPEYNGVSHLPDPQMSTFRTANIEVVV